MKSRFTILLVMLAACLLVGCTSFDPDKFSTQVEKWVPLGTSAKEAQHIMEKHGFECELLGKDHPLNRQGVECLDCEKFAVWLHTWNAQIFFQDDVVSGYGNMTVE